MTPPGDSPKIGRNQPCPCGSGKKYKKCHGKLDARAAAKPQFKTIPWSEVPEEVRREYEAHLAKQAAREAAHGKGKPIISTEFKDMRIVAVGNELHWSPKDNTKYFPDFLGKYLKGMLEPSWGNAEIKKPLIERHQILKWYDSLCRYEATIPREPDGSFQAAATGSMLAWYRLGYDLYQIKHNAALQKKIIGRLRDTAFFQGARFELCVTAAMITADFEIAFEDETDGTRKHAEFIAKHKSGVNVAVEVKSRHRPGVLDFYSAAAEVTDKASIEGILRDALAKRPDGPFFVFIEVNLQVCLENPAEDPRNRELADTVAALKQEWEPGTFPANAIFFYNDASYHIPDAVPERHNVWCYEVPTDNPKYPLPEPSLSMSVAAALLQRANFPMQFPDPK